MTPIDTKELQDLRIKLFDATMRKTAADISSHILEVILLGFFHIEVFLHGLGTARGNTQFFIKLRQ